MQSRSLCPSTRLSTHPKSLHLLMVLQTAGQCSCQACKQGDKHCCTKSQTEHIIISFGWTHQVGNRRLEASLISPPVRMERQSSHASTPDPSNTSTGGPTWWAAPTVPVIRPPFAAALGGGAPERAPKPKISHLYPFPELTGTIPLMLRLLLKNQDDSDQTPL